MHVFCLPGCFCCPCERERPILFETLRSSFLVCAFLLIPSLSLIQEKKRFQVNEVENNSWHTCSRILLVSFQTILSSSICVQGLLTKQGFFTLWQKVHSGCYERRQGPQMKVYKSFIQCHQTNMPSFLKKE